MPRISVITPLFNKGPFVAETIKSLQSQTLADWEMILVENGSTDDGPAISRKFAEADSRIRFVASPRRGPGAARNFGLTLATGEWIQFLDADDLLEPSHFSQQIEAASRASGASIVAGSWQEFRTESTSSRTLKKPAGRDVPRQTMLDCAVAFAPWAVHAVLVRRPALDAAHQWPEELDRFLGEDIAFWFPLLRDCEVAYSSANGALYRVETASSRNQVSNIEAWYTGVHAAVQRNVRVATQKDGRLTPGQAEQLVRLYSGLHLKARRANNTRIASEALAIAQSRLRERSEMQAPLPLSMRLRQWLGPGLYEGAKDRMISLLGRLRVTG